MSSELGDTFRAWNEEKKIRKENKLAEAELRFNELPAGTRKLTTYHWRIPVGSVSIDYWPSTGKFRRLDRNHNKHGDFDRLLAWIKNISAQGVTDEQ